MKNLVTLKNDLAKQEYILLLRLKFAVKISHADN